MCAGQQYERYGKRYGKWWREPSGIAPVRTPVVPQSLASSCGLCSATRVGEYRLRGGDRVYRIALTVILEVGSVAEEGVEVHELECGPQVVLRE